MAISFKSDESFLRKLAIGAIGTRATMKKVTELGYEPIELSEAPLGTKFGRK